MGIFFGLLAIMLAVKWQQELAKRKHTDDKLESTLVALKARDKEASQACAALLKAGYCKDDVGVWVPTDSVEGTLWYLRKRNKELEGMIDKAAKIVGVPRQIIGTRLFEGEFLCRAMEAVRRSDCLTAIEIKYFYSFVPGGGHGVPAHECLLRNNLSPAQYVENFGKALEQKAKAQTEANEE